MFSLDSTPGRIKGTKLLTHPIFNHHPFAQLFKLVPAKAGKLAAGGMLFFVVLFLNDQRERVVKLFNRFSS